MIFTFRLENKNWYLNGCPHRLDGPAIIKADDFKIWYKMEKLHRLNSPAIMRTGVLIG